MIWKNFHLMVQIILNWTIEWIKPFCSTSLLLWRRRKSFFFDCDHASKSIIGSYNADHVLYFSNGGQVAMSRWVPRPLNGSLKTQVSGSWCCRMIIMMRGTLMRRVIKREATLSQQRVIHNEFVKLKRFKRGPGLLKLLWNRPLSLIDFWKSHFFASMTKSQSVDDHFLSCHAF